MIRLALAAALALPGLAGAEPSATVTGPPRAAAPETTPETTRAPEAPCENTRDEGNCSRILACIGEDGLWFDGRADGWNRGTVTGRLSDGTACEGTWRYDILGLTASVRFGCEDGRRGRARFTAQDPETGTGIGRGTTADGAAVRIWGGRRVLDYLTPEGERRAFLPCESGAIPVS